MNLKHYLKKAISMPPQELAKKVLNKINTKVKDKLQKSKDLNKDTHINFDVALIKNSYVDIKELDTSNIDIKVARYLSQMYCEHRFDLLGSGWVKNSYDSVALGVEGYKYDMNVQAPQSIADEYEPIDWQKDYKSGYRWNEKTWYKDQPLGHKLGVDIKVPWELARFQHLPQLAIFAIADASLKEQNIKEFKHQVLDFIVNNPPRMGVNWVCTMDVGIRVANMLVAYDMFIQLDSGCGFLDDEFKQTFANSIYEHGIHIINNLEWSENFRSNHYLADISGLLFVASYLKSSDETNGWLVFCIQEIIEEMNIEFYEDGGNFEGSTSYHRLSGEMMVYSTALILGLKEEKVKSLQNYTLRKWKVKPKLLPCTEQKLKINNSTSKIELPQWYINRLFKIGRFTVDITKQNGEIVQFGDNDSGRFFRFSPNGEFVTNQEAVKKYLNLNRYIENDELFWDENILNHTTFISSFRGLFEDVIFDTAILFEKSFVKSLSQLVLECLDKSYKDVKLSKIDKKLDYVQKTIYKSHARIERLRVTCYPDSGVYIIKADNLHLAISASDLHYMNNGHNHNDKLSYELWLDNKDIVQDAGTYLYTSLPQIRNRFRSVKAHNTIIFNDSEQNDFLDKDSGSIFLLKNETKVKVLEVSSEHIIVSVKYKQYEHIREIRIKNNQIVVVDNANSAFKVNFNKMYSNGYGKRMS